MNQLIRYVVTILAIGLSATYLEPSFAEIGFEESSETENITEVAPTSAESDSSEILAEVDRELISIEENNVEEIDVEVEESQRIPLPCRIFPSASMEQ